MGSQRVQHNLATEHSTVKGSFILFPLYYIFLILHFLIYCKLHWPILCPSKECKKSRIIFFICPDAYHFCCFFFRFLCYKFPCHHFSSLQRASYNNSCRLDQLSVESFSFPSSVNVCFRLVFLKDFFAEYPIPS